MLTLFIATHNVFATFCGTEIIYTVSTEVIMLAVRHWDRHMALCSEKITNTKVDFSRQPRSVGMSTIVASHAERVKWARTRLKFHHKFFMHTNHQKMEFKSFTSDLSCDEYFSLHTLQSSI